MNHAKTSSYKLITIPFIFTKDLKKKIEEIMNAIPIECIPEQLRIETCVFSLHLIVIKVPYF